MGTVISSLGTLGRFTKNSQQAKIVYDAGSSLWWAFYYKSGTANTLFYAYASTLNGTWTEASVALGGTVVTDGGSVAITYLGSASVVFVTYYTDTNDQRYMRGNISGTTITWSANTNFFIDTAKNASSDYCFAPALEASTSKVNILRANSGGNVTDETSTNPLSTSFSDTNTAWTAFDFPNHSDFDKRNALFPLTGTDFIAISGDITGGNGFLKSLKRASGTWDAAWTNLFTAAAGADSLQWGAAQVSATATFVLAISATSTMNLYKFDGSSWSTMTAPAYPTNGLASNSGLALISNGTDIWAFCIRGDGSSTLSYNKYTVGSNSWSGWTTMETTAPGTDVSAAFAVSVGKVPVLYTNTNGGNFDLVVAFLDLGGGGGGPTCLNEPEWHPMEQQTNPLIVSVW